jgi:hypothetical protein
MTNGLSKKQLQETLREMGIDFPADAGRDDLKAILDRANQEQWLKAAHRNTAGRQGRVIRRRGGRRQKSEKEKAPRPVSASGPKSPPSSVSKPLQRSLHQKIERTAATASPRLPKEHLPSRIFDRTTDLEAYALERADGICDLCGRRPDKDGDGRPLPLKPCFFMEPPDGRPHTTKTVAALCSECCERIGTSPALCDLKVLKRKARQPRTKEITISRKKRPRTPGKTRRTRSRK